MCITWADVTQLKISHAPHNHKANTSNKSILALYTMVELWQKAIINNGAVAHVVAFEGSRLDDKHTRTDFTNIIHAAN